MDLDDNFRRYRKLVQKVASGQTARSENDLSSRLTRVFESLSLNTVVDTGAPTGGRKRPDILAFTSRDDADLVLPAEVVIESKKPDELKSFDTLIDVLEDPEFWEDKSYPYIRDNITRIRYFGLTTFTQLLLTPVTQVIRQSLIDSRSHDDSHASDARQRLAGHAELFDLTDPSDAKRCRGWLSSHLSLKRLQPPPLSEVRNAKPVTQPQQLAGFAHSLAEIAAGRFGRQSSHGLFHSVRSNLPSDYSALDSKTRRDLHLFLMGKNPGMPPEEVRELAEEDLSSSLDSFVGASIHSLISRLFALSVVEDVYCVNRNEPLIAPDLWVVNRTDYDNLSPSELRKEVFQRLHNLRESDNAVIKSLAVYGFFFDWIRDHVDPMLFRSLLDQFVSHDLTEIKGDVLGRFYELYLQEVDRARRKQLGQYYTPYPIVRFMWSVTERHLEKQDAFDSLRVLDPGMGSGTFLAEGARVLADNNVPQFWKRLVGFDLASEVLGIAHSNIYMAVLSKLPRSDALNVKELPLYITDSLDPRNGQYLEQILPLITSDEDRAYVEQRVELSSSVKTAESFTVVLGNPPYHNNSRLTLRQVAERFPRLLDRARKESAAQERNIRDDYAWFFAAADYYVQDAGAITFICSDSYARKFSYRYFREELLRHYTVEALVRLGERVFRDVSPRISFAVICLRRRGETLDDVEDMTPIPFWDFAGLADGVPNSQLGTPDDPRFAKLEELSEDGLTDPHNRHKPRAEQNYVLYPQGPVVDRVQTNSAPVYRKDVPDRIFQRKWPGIITAFDDFFKSSDQNELKKRIKSFHRAVDDSGNSDYQLQNIVVSWAKERHFKEKWFERLVVLAKQVRKPQITFDAEKVKRTLGGSIADSVRWYPSPDCVTYIYYEPQLHIPRKKHEGKRKGWGTMEQWREPISHSIRPKLVYTTASKVKYGYRAFVLNDEWYIKLHGGTSQQYHYTGTDYPGTEQRSDGLPNNLTDVGVRLLKGFRDAGIGAAGVLHYISGIYNSNLAASFLDNASSGVQFKIRLPDDAKEWSKAHDIAQAALLCRDLEMVRYRVSETDSVKAEHVPKSLKDGELDGLGFELVERSSARYGNEKRYQVVGSAEERIRRRVEELEEEIEQLVDSLYT